MTSDLHPCFSGNIIHAIATTNATISGLIVTEALKILTGNADACRASYLYEVASNRRLIVVCAPSPPRPSCAVCGKAQLHLRINTETTTLAAFVDGILKKRLCLVQPSVMCGDFLYEEGEGLDDEEVGAGNRLRPALYAVVCCFTCCVKVAFCMKRARGWMKKRWGSGPDCGLLCTL